MGTLCSCFILVRNYRLATITPTKLGLEPEKDDWRSNILYIGMLGKDLRNFLYLIARYCTYRFLICTAVVAGSQEWINSRLLDTDIYSCTVGDLFFSMQTWRISPTILCICLFLQSESLHTKQKALTTIHSQDKNPNSENFVWIPVWKARKAVGGEVAVCQI